MQYCQVTVHINGSPMHSVAKKVTVPEIAILRSIHGVDAIRDVALLGDYVPKDENGDTVEYDDGVERGRLVKTYESVGAADMAGTVDRLFPALSPLPSRLSQIGIDPKAEAAAKRAAAAQLSAEAEALEAPVKSFGKPYVAGEAKGPRQVPDDE